MTLLDLATETAIAAGRLLLDYQQRTLTVETKTSETDPVSEADRAAEQLIAERIFAARPDDGLLAEEEQDNRSGTTGLRWVVDPLDGTVNYLYGIPQWCVSIACEDGSGALAGVVHDPSSDTTFAAARGEGATQNRAEIRVSDRQDLRRALIATGFAYDPEMRVSQGRASSELLAEVRDLRRFGAAALDLAWVACGRVDGYVEHGLQPWDWSAGGLIVAEAGGVVERRRDVIAGRERDGLIAAAPGIAAALRDWVDAAYA